MDMDLRKKQIKRNEKYYNIYDLTSRKPKYKINQ